MSDTKRTYIDFIKDIGDNIKKTEEFTEGYNYER